MTRIVALHGFLGHARDWEPLKASLTKLATDLDFQAVELFSGGEIQGLSEWAKKFNQEQRGRHVERNILVGYSLGGRLALQAAIDKPGLWDEVVLISSHPGYMSDEERQERLRSDRVWAEKFIQLPWEEVVHLWNDQPVFAGSEEPERLEGEHSRELLSKAIVQWSLANQNFEGEALVNLKPKLHWYAGEKDERFVGLFQHLKVDGFIEDVQVIKNAGHRLIFDNPEELAQQLVHSLKL